MAIKSGAQANLPQAGLGLATFVLLIAMRTQKSPQHAHMRKSTHKWLPLLMLAFFAAGCGSEGQSQLETVTSDLCADNLNLTEVTAIETVTGLRVTDAAGNSLLTEDNPTYAHTIYEGTQIYETLLIPMEAGFLLITWTARNNFYAELDSATTDVEMEVGFYEASAILYADECLYRNSGRSSYLNCLDLESDYDFIDGEFYLPSEFMSDTENQITIRAEATLDQLGYFEINVEAQTSARDITATYPDHKLVLESISIFELMETFDLFAGDISCICPDEYPIRLSFSTSDEYRCDATCGNYIVQNTDGNFIASANEDAHLISDSQSSTLCREFEENNNDVLIENVSL